MKKPFIAISTYDIDEKKRYYLPQEYVTAVRKAGGIAVLIPPGDLDINIDIFQGLLLTGGGDIDPEKYSGKKHKNIYGVSVSRDDMELTLFSEFHKQRKPILCICRGMQVANVALQGTLHEHLPDVYGDKIIHRKEPLEPIEHSITLKKEGLLSSICGGEKISPMSWHHQSIDKLGKNLVATAYSDDGVIEAIEEKQYPFMIGVQWHPELTAQTQPEQQKIFNEFIKNTQNFI